MLEKIVIKNFQSHRDTELILSDGVNVIVGDTDSGKSSVLRALTWAIDNKCDDSSFIRRGENEVSVELTFDDFTVERKRDKDNIYNLTVGKKTQKFKAFKQAIPSDIVDLLNMSDVNIQSQLEAPFLLSQSAGEVAKTLNRMVDLSIIHESISEIKKQVLFNNREIENISKQIEDNKILLEQFGFIPALEKKVEGYECLAKEQVALETKISDQAKLMSRFYTYRDKVDSFDEILAVEDKVNKATESISKYKKQAQQIKTIATLIDSICDNQTEYKRLEKLIELDPKVKEAVELVKTISKLSDEIAITDRHYKANNRLESSIEKMEIEYIDAMPEECPLCGNVMLGEE